MVVRINADQGIAAEFFNQSLEAAGYSVDLSEANEEGWLIEFSRDGAKGTIDLTTPLLGISQAIIRFNVP